MQPSIDRTWRQKVWVAAWGWLLLIGCAGQAWAQPINSDASKAAAGGAIPKTDYLRVGVTDFVYDDIPSVLESLQIPYERTSTVDRPLESFDVIFIGCGSTEMANLPPRGVQEFVKRGGVLYVSDLSYPVLQRAFPEMVGGWRTDGQVAKLPCRVLDRKLAEVVGQQITLNFDAGGWAYAPRPHRLVEVLVEYKSSAVSIPVLLSFSFGKGKVIYTSFHNHANASELETKLIRALVEAPVDAAKTIRSQLAAGVGDPRSALGGLSDSASDTAQTTRPLTAAAIAAMTADQLVASIDWTNAKTTRAALTDLFNRKGAEATVALSQAIAAAPAAQKAVVRQLLAQRLQRFKSTTLAQYLDLQDHAELRAAAATAIAAKGEKSLMPKLVEQLTDTDPYAADAAHAALVELSGKQFGRFTGAGAVERFVVAKRWQEWLAESTP